MMMRSDIVRLCAACSMIFLMESVSADSIREVFAVNRELILSRNVTELAGYVFTVGKAKSSPKAGESVGYSKASSFAYGNIELLNFQKAQWPEDATAEEKIAVWRLYRALHPVRYTVSNGVLVHKALSDRENYLVVLAFPEDSIKTEPVRKSDLLPVLSEYRAEIAKGTSETRAKGLEAKEREAAECEAKERKLEKSDNVIINNTLDESLIF